jgi:hypothetical protein
MPWIDDLPAEIADSLSEEVKENPTLAQYNSLEEALKGHIKTKSLVGSSIRVPGPDAGEEDTQAFYQKILDKDLNLMLKPDFSEPEQAKDFYNLYGKPGDAAQYKMPEGHTLAPDVESELREMSFSAHMNQEQFQNLVTGMDGRNQQLQENTKGQYDESMESLRGKWGMAFEDRSTAAKEINKEYYPDRLFDNLTASEREALYAISESLTGKGAQVAGQGDGQVAAVTPTEAREQAEEIMRRVHDPKSDLDHSAKMALINKRIKLLQKYVPEFAEAG